MFIDQRNFVHNDGAYLLNQNGQGMVGSGMNDVRWESGLRRPYLWQGSDGRLKPWVTVNTGRREWNAKDERFDPVFAQYPLEYLASRYQTYSPVGNATLLQKDAWIEFDRTIVRATRLRLRAFTDLETRNPRSGFNAMGKLTLEYTTMSDVGIAVQDMDGISEGQADRYSHDIKSIPLPITHSDFYFSQREIMVSRNTSTPLDTTMIEQAGRRVAELIEKQTIGTEAGIAFGTRSTGPFPHTGTSKAYGYTNFPYRVTKTDLTTPTGNNPDAIVEDVIEMMETMYSNGFFGPFILYHSTPYSKYFAKDYGVATGSSYGFSPSQSLIMRLKQLEGLEDIRRLDFLTSGFQLVLVQMTPEVCQGVNGMDIQTVMWEEKGGSLVRFKVLCIKVALLKAPLNGISGIIHGTTS